VLAFLTRESLAFLAFLTVELTTIYLAVVLLVELLQNRLGADRLGEMLGDKVGVSQFAVAAGFGALTPFCSCSTVPVVAGMDRAGVAWPVLSSFLVISPLVNPALFALMWGLVGVKYALFYVAASLVVAVAVGLVIHQAGWASSVPETSEGTGGCGASEEGPATEPGWHWGSAWREAWQSTLELSPIFLAAGLIGTALKFWVGTGWIEGLLAGAGWWGVPLAAIVGVPVYASTAVLLPLGALLLQQGAGLGIVTAFLMGATGFSVPEGIMLKEIIGGRRLAVLAGAFTVAVIGAGYGFQFVPA
jgi:uncharacterized membrane protein YraQ (UPF0718 family)